MQQLVKVPPRIGAYACVCIAEHIIAQGVLSFLGRNGQATIALGDGPMARTVTGTLIPAYRRPLT